MRIFIIGLILLITTLSYADEISVPFACYPKKVQEVFALNNLKLDLSGNDRTPESWGFIENKGTSFTLYSYKTLTKDELKRIENIILGR